MTRGFLLIDQQKNTVIIPADDPDFVEFFRYKTNGPSILENVRQHSTIKELDTDVRAYLKSEYDG